MLGGLIALPSFLRANGINPNNADLQGTIVAIYDIGCLTGCIICGFVGQMMGRRMFIVIGGLLVLLGAGLQAGAHGVSYLISGRVIAGIGMGFNTTMVPVWVAETSKAATRGALIATQLSIGKSLITFQALQIFLITLSLHSHSRTDHRLLV